MALSRILDDSEWPQEIADAAHEEFTGVISVIDPGTGNPGVYSAETDIRTGATPDDVVLDDRAARIQHIRLPLEMAGSREWSTKRRYRFQIDLLPGDPIITKGMVVRVTNGGRDASLTSFAFTVTAASNSSHAAVRTIETVTELAVL